MISFLKWKKSKKKNQEISRSHMRDTGGTPETAKTPRTSGDSEDLWKLRGPPETPRTSGDSGVRKKTFGDFLAFGSTDISILWLSVNMRALQATHIFKRDSRNLLVVATARKNRITKNKTNKTRRALVPKQRKVSMRPRSTESRSRAIQKRKTALVWKASGCKKKIERTQFGQKSGEKNWWIHQSN